jgi:hypothetical protein
MGLKQKRELLKELAKEMQSDFLYLPAEIIVDLDNLVEKTRKEINDQIGESRGVRERFVITFLERCL